MQESTKSTLNKHVLLQAWARLSVYDRTASDLKQRHIQRRYIVLGITLVATIASVVTGLITQITFAKLLGGIAIALPLIGAFLMTDVIQFTGTTDWIKYRYVAERMRMHIYLYRMQAGDYETNPEHAHDTDKILIEKLKVIRNEISLDEAIPPSISQPSDPEAIKAAIQRANSSTLEDAQYDDGLSEISGDNYVKWRIDRQRDWYSKKLNGDFARLKKFSRAARLSLLIGSLVGAFVGAVDVRAIAIIAITNSISASLASWSEVSMVGKTYALFRITSRQLEDIKLHWLAEKNDPESDDAVRKENLRNLVVTVENTLDWERGEWYETALQSQELSDQMIQGDLKKLNERATEAQFKEPNSSE